MNWSQYQSYQKECNDRDSSRDGNFRPRQVQSSQRECSDRDIGSDGDLRPRQVQVKSRQLEVGGSCGLRQRERLRYSLRFEAVAV